MSDYNKTKAINSILKAIEFTGRLPVSEDTIYTQLKLREALKKLEETK